MRLVQFGSMKSWKSSDVKNIHYLSMLYRIWLMFEYTYKQDKKGKYVL